MGTLMYWMKFYDNSDELIIGLSDITFLGKSFDVVDIKRRFNEDFVQGTTKAVQLSFAGLGITKSFFAGIRDKKVVIIDEDTRKEYSTKEFSQELNILNSVLTNQLSLQGA